MKREFINRLIRNVFEHKNLHEFRVVFENFTSLPIFALFFYSHLSIFYSVFSLVAVGKYCGNKYIHDPECSGKLAYLINQLLCVFYIFLVNIICLIDINTK